MTSPTLFGLRTLCVVTALGAATAAHAGSYTITTLDAPGGMRTFAYGLNNLDQVVGSVDQNFQSSGSHDFLWSAGTFTEVDKLIGFTAPYLSAINDSGVAVGFDGHGATVYRSVDGSISHPFFKLGSRSPKTNFYGINARGFMVGLGPNLDGVIVHGGQLVDSVKVDGHETFLTDINAQGESVGAYFDGTTEIFSYSGGVVTKLTLPQHVADLFVIPSIAPDGRVSGTIRRTPHGPNKGFVFGHDGYETIVFPGAAETSVTATNAIGTFGVYSTSGSNQSAAFVTKARVYHAIQLPGSFQTMAAVNDHGDFVGTYTTPSDGVVHGYIATCAADQQPCTQWAATGLRG